MIQRLCQSQEWILSSHKLDELAVGDRVSFKTKRKLHGLRGLDCTLVPPLRDPVSLCLGFLSYKTRIDVNLLQWRVGVGVGAKSSIPGLQLAPRMWALSLNSQLRHRDMALGPFPYYRSQKWGPWITLPLLSHLPFFLGLSLHSASWCPFFFCLPHRSSVCLYHALCLASQSLVAFLLIHFSCGYQVADLVSSVLKSPKWYPITASCFHTSEGIRIIWGKLPYIENSRVLSHRGLDSGMT